MYTYVIDDMLCLKLTNASVSLCRPYAGDAYIVAKVSQHTLWQGKA